MGDERDPDGPWVLSPNAPSVAYPKAHNVPSVFGAIVAVSADSELFQFVLVPI